MKKLTLVLIAITLISFTSCKKDKKEVIKETEITTTKKSVTYMADPSATEIQWTAYKTTAKKPVSGVFKTVKFEKKTGSTPVETLNGLEFTIPISSLFSKNEERDGKLIASFFGSMVNSDFLKGTIHFSEGDTCNIDITMNGETHPIAFTYSIKENVVDFKGVMNLENWSALSAIEALNKVCFDLHKGDDGVSKTWNDVAIEVSTTLMKH